MMSVPSELNLLREPDGTPRVFRSIFPDRDPLEYVFVDGCFVPLSHVLSDPLPAYLAQLGDA